MISIARNTNFDSAVDLKIAEGEQASETSNH